MTVSRPLTRANRPRPEAGPTLRSFFLRLYTLCRFCIPNSVRSLRVQFSNNF
jgi:hypothetical protein